MARTNAQQWMSKWGTNLGNSTQYIKDGVARVQVAPGVAAAAAQDRMLSGIQRSVQSGKWAKNVASVSLQDWQTAMTTKGINRLTDGINTAKTRKIGAITTLLANVDQAAAAANNLPKGGLQQGIARATTFMTQMSQLSNPGGAS